MKQGKPFHNCTMYWVNTRSSLICCFAFFFFAQNRNHLMAGNLKGGDHWKRRRGGGNLSARTKLLATDCCWKYLEEGECGHQWDNLDDDVFVTKYSLNDPLRDLRFGRGVSLMNLCKCSDLNKAKMTQKWHKDGWLRILVALLGGLDDVE